MSLIPKEVQKIAIFALALTSIGSGCNFRFGNQVVAPSHPDNVSGYYESAPQSLVFCANVPPAGEKCVTAATNLVPYDVADVMTNPLALMLEDPQADPSQPRSAYFVGLGANQVTLPVSVYPDFSLDFLGSTATETLWDDKACTTKLYAEETGKVNLGGPYTTGTTRPLAGRIEVEIQMIRTFNEKCPASLSSMHQCYLNPSQCGGSSDSSNLKLQAFVQSLFDDWIHAGAMSADDIPYVTNVAYKVSYQ